MVYEDGGMEMPISFLVLAISQSFEWQWNVIIALTETFPRVQFIVATYSPIVISSWKYE